MQINIKNIEIDNNYGCKDVIFTGCFLKMKMTKKTKEMKNHL